MDLNWQIYFLTFDFHSFLDAFCFHALSTEGCHSKLMTRPSISLSRNLGNIVRDKNTTSGITDKRKQKNVSQGCLKTAMAWIYNHIYIR